MGLRPSTAKGKGKRWQEKSNEGLETTKIRRFRKMMQIKLMQINYAENEKLGIKS